MIKSFLWKLRTQFWPNWQKVFVWKFKNYSVKFREREKRNLLKKKTFDFSECSCRHVERTFLKTCREKFSKTTDKCFICGLDRKFISFQMQNFSRKMYLSLPRIQVWPPWQKLSARDREKSVDVRKRFFFSKEMIVTNISLLKVEQ